MANPHFDALGVVESPLYSDLMREAIYNHGIEAKYLIRTDFNTDDILGKSDGLFDNAVNIDVVITETSNLDSESDMFEKFGIQIDKTIGFAVHKDAFTEAVGTNPDKGDLIYLAPWDMMLEVSSIDSMNVLQFGSSHVFQFGTTIYENTGDEFQTGIPDIDDTADDYTLDMNNISDEAGLTARFTQLAEFAEDNPFSGNF